MVANHHQNVMQQNCLQLFAALQEVQALRYTPAGIAVRNCTLVHESEQVQAGRVRKVNLHIRAVALDQLALQLEGWQTGQQAVFSGFLSTPHWGNRPTSDSTSVVFHLQAIQPVHSS